MVHHIAKRQKVYEVETGKEAVLFNSDTLSKIISYLPSIDLLSLSLTCKRFGVSDDDELSVIKKSAQIIVQDVATGEQLAALPHYDGESSLADYHYLQLMRAPLTFDKLVGDIEISSDKSCVKYNGGVHLATAFSDNILRAGKHYATFSHQSNNRRLMVGVMRPGRANQNASGSPRYEEFYDNFSQTHAAHYNNSSVQCCLLGLATKNCLSSGWDDEINNETESWEGSEHMSSGDAIGLLLDLDEGTLSFYNNGRKLGVMKKGLTGPYCWVVSFYSGNQVTMKRGTIPSS